LSDKNSTWKWSKYVQPPSRDLGDRKHWVGLGGLIIKRYELLSKAVPTWGRGCL
jgi:hypothetical protein